MCAPENEKAFFAEWKIRYVPESSKTPQETCDKRLEDLILSCVCIRGASKDIELAQLQFGTLDFSEMQEIKYSFFENI